MTHTICIQTHEFVNGEDRKKITEQKKKSKTLLAAEKHDLFPYSTK